MINKKDKSDPIDNLEYEKILEEEIINSYESKFQKDTEENIKKIKFYRLKRTPLEILPEWYLYPVFQILRVVPNKLLGIALQTLIPLGLMILPFIENVNKFSNPFRRPIAMSVFLFGTFLTIYLGIGACLPIDKSLTLGLF